MATPEPDNELFVRYHARHQRRVFSYILTLVPNWNDAEEVFQETTLVLWKKFSDFLPGTSYISWANRVAYYEVLKFRGRQKSSGHIFSNELIDAISSKTNEMRELLDDHHEALQYCLEKLPKDDRKLIFSRYFRGASARSLAQELGRPRRSVINSLKRIRIALLSCVRRQEMGTVS